MSSYIHRHKHLTFSDPCKVKLKNRTIRSSFAPVLWRTLLGADRWPELEQQSGRRQLLWGSSLRAALPEEGAPQPDKPNPRKDDLQGSKVQNIVFNSGILQQKYKGCLKVLKIENQHILHSYPLCLAAGTQPSSQGLCSSQGPRWTSSWGALWLPPARIRNKHIYKKMLQMNWF